MKSLNHLKTIITNTCFTFTICMAILLIISTLLGENTLETKAILSMGGASLSSGVLQLVWKEGSTLWKQCIAHFVLLYLTLLLFAYAGNWMPFNKASAIISFTIIYIIIYIFIFLGFYFSLKRQEKIMNNKLVEYKKNIK